MILEWIASGDVALFSPMILACRGQGRPRQYILAVWIPFIHPGHFFLFGVGLRLKCVGGCWFYT